MEYNSKNSPSNELLTNVFKFVSRLITAFKTEERSISQQQVLSFYHIQDWPSRGEIITAKNAMKLQLLQQQRAEKQEVL